jgi:hypothetical protein
METRVAFYAWRQQRLARGWEPVQMVGRMRILADRDGVALPHTWRMIRLVFLWEHHRAPLPGYYAWLLYQIFTTSNSAVRG